MNVHEKIEKKRNFLGIEVDTLSWWGLLIAAASATTALSAYVWWFGLLSAFNGLKDGEGWAHFGDYFGGVVGPLIGFASIMLLVATLHQQRKQLDDQRNMLALQNFEQTFFRRLEGYLRH